MAGSGDARPAGEPSLDDEGALSPAGRLRAGRVTKRGESSSPSTSESDVAAWTARGVPWDFYPSPSMSERRPPGPWGSSRQDELPGFNDAVREHRDESQIGKMNAFAFINRDIAKCSPCPAMKITPMRPDWGRRLQRDRLACEGAASLIKSRNEWPAAIDQKSAAPRKSST
jgi:hypothetical protein